MGLVENLRSKSAALAGQAMTKLFADEKRAQQIGEMINLVQRSRRRIDEAQERALKELGVASSGDLKAAGKRLAALRKSARQLDEKLGALAGKVNGEED
jgi:hypothetical protein